MRRKRISNIMKKKCGTKRKKENCRNKRKKKRQIWG